MAAGQWMANGFQWAGKLPSRVQGVYSPVAGASASRRSAGYFGTPEIYFAKNIDNSRLVKVTDRERTREIAQFMAAAACLFLLVMFYAWQHFSSIEYGYRIEAQRKQVEELVENNRALRLEEASLRDPERIDTLARQLGLQSPQAGQVQQLDTSLPSGAPIMARMNEVSVVTLAQ
jgi:cell division protein FtsL